MRDTLSDRIEACIAIEVTFAEIYHALSDMFPEERNFFRELASEEENHAAILAVGRGYEKAGKLPPEVVPDSIVPIQGTLDNALNFKAKIAAGSIAIGEALATMLQFEESTCDSYFHEMMTRESDSKVITNLQKLLIDTRSHAEKIRELIKNRNP